MSEEEWFPVSSAPVNKWIRTRREGEEGSNVCCLRKLEELQNDGSYVFNDDEWIERDSGITTVTHSTFLPPTHWRPLTLYCVGLLFEKGDHQQDRVVLIRKNRPSWQKGKLNGLGGTVNENENPHEAMVREFKEESGATIDRWNPLAVIESRRGWTCFFFYAHHHFHDVMTGPLSPTDERVTIRSVNLVSVDPTLVSNLRWLLPLALDTSGIVLPIRLKDAGDY